AGFLQRGETTPTVSPDIPPVHVVGMRRLLRMGQRPPLWVYQAKLPLGQNLVCSDDVAPLLAYRAERIRKIPVIILRPRRTDLEESALIFRYLASSRQSPAIFVEAQRPRTKHVPSINGAALRSRSSDAILAKVYRALVWNLLVLRRFNLR